MLFLCFPRCNSTSFLCQFQVVNRMKKKKKKEVYFWLILKSKKVICSKKTGVSILIVKSVMELCAFVLMQ